MLLSIATPMSLPRKCGTPESTRTVAAPPSPLVSIKSGRPGGSSSRKRLRNESSSLSLSEVRYEDKPWPTSRGRPRQHAWPYSP